MREGYAEWRTVPAALGPSPGKEGWFHSKVILFDEHTGVVGSANLTGVALGLSIPPHHTEMSVGLQGPGAQDALDTLSRTFEKWWQRSKPVPPPETEASGGENAMNHTPEYVAFKKRPAWGIAQVQTVGGDIFGKAQWLAISDISPADPERLPAHIQVPNPRIAQAEAVDLPTPAANLAGGQVPSAAESTSHFRRLCAYWLQAENRQGQLDNIPVLPLRHQESLVEYLTRRESPRRMLIADEVGLGKTVEIGLLIERLQAADPDIRVLYVTLGGLVPNVAEQFTNMGFDRLRSDRFYIYGNRALDETQYPPARLGGPDSDRRVVASLHRLAFRREWETRLEGTKWDVVVVDECHRLRMYGTGEDTKAQKWFRVVERILREHLAEDGRVYFLSGTPHQGNPEVFLNLAGLLFGLERGAPPREQRRALRGRVIYRIKEGVLDWDGLPLFPKRDIREPRFAAIPHEYNTLLSEIADYFDWLLQEGAQRAIGFVKSNALQYAASSPRAGFAYLLRRYLRNFSQAGNRNRMEGWAGLLVPYRNRPANERPESLLDYLIGAVREEEEEDPEDTDTGTLSEAVGSGLPGPTSEEDQRRLGQLLDKYARLLQQEDLRAKFQELGKLLEEADEPYVVFAQSVDTVYEIKRFLEERRIPFSIIVGGQDPADRKGEMEEFRRPGTLGRRVLVSSAAGGEGLNLQVARRLIHFDLPWNPMVLEQRIGRVHRIGAINTVIVDTILLQGSMEADIYQRLIDRLTTIVGALADDPNQRAEYFRRILAGIPLERLRELFSGQRGDDDAIAEAVLAGKRAVQDVDNELQQHRVQLTTEDKGRATMEKLALLLESADKIRRIRKDLNYTRIKFDPAAQHFIAEEVACPCYRIHHGDGDAGIDWVVFDREAAAKSSEVTRNRTGGINHPLISLALASLRTPANAEDFPRLTLGIRTYNRDYVQLLGAGKSEPLLLLTYMTAYLSGQQFFNHRLRVFALSPSQLSAADISSDGKVIEEIFWAPLEEKRLERPNLPKEFLQQVTAQDKLLRTQLEAEVRDEQGHWQGAVWPLAVTILMPTDDAQLPPFIPQIHEHDVVALLSAMPEEGLQAGASGTVVHIYRSAKAFEVEFLTPEGSKVITLSPSSIRPVTRK